MKVPYSWLSEFVDIDLSVTDLADKLVSCGFEIEEVIYAKDSIKNVVVGKIKSIEKHQNSEHLCICQIDIGNKVVQIVTGATNIKVNDYVPVALDGALLPDGKKIKSGELRGVISDGMLCSGGELNLVEDDYEGAGVYGILILKGKNVPGTDINDVIGNNEVILDVAVTANRPDCNSILGIAREVAAVTNKKLRLPKTTYKCNKESINDYVTIENDEYALCPRYAAAAVKNVKIVESPKIMRDRLKAVGLRPINNLIDVTNYILYEIGQPMHAFDLNNLESHKIVIRTAKENEKIVALDDKEYTLSDNNLVICDSVKPVAVAGVMGGKYSSICDTTSTVILESARFARDSIRHTSRDLNLKSDSSARFEKGIDFVSQDIGLNRALALFDEYRWGEIVGGKIDLIKESFEDKILTYNYQDINKIIGKPIEKSIIMKILNSLTLKTTANGDILTTVVPNYREDILGINDLTEEVIRIYGYEIIEPRFFSNTKGGMTVEQNRMDKVKQLMVGKGAFEILSYSFISPKAFDMLKLAEDDHLRKAITLANPIGLDFSVMRTTLSYSMIKTIANNLTRGNKEGRLFEIAKTYIPKELPLTELPIEKYKLTIGLFGENESYYTLKSIIDDMSIVFDIELSYERIKLSFLHTGRSAKIMAGGVCVGYLGEVHPDVNKEFDIDKKIYIAEIDVEYFVKNGIDIKPYKAVSKYQGMERDLALIAPITMPASTILNNIKKSCSELLESAEVFDVYTGVQVGVGKKSIAIKLYFVNNTRTLVEAEVNNEIANVLFSLEELNVYLR
jgi:phenylalanyl-tRNA synthetase beta chain